MGSYLRSRRVCGEQRQDCLNESQVQTNADKVTTTWHSRSGMEKEKNYAARNYAVKERAGVGRASLALPKKNHRGHTRR